MAMNGRTGRSSSTAAPLRRSGWSWSGRSSSVSISAFVSSPAKRKNRRPSANENLYHQADNSPARKQDYNYLDATRPKETVEPQAKPEPSVQAYRAPDPLAEARRREEEEARRSGLFPQGAQDLRQRAGIAAAGAGANPLAGLDLAGLNLPSVQDLLPGNAPSAAERKQAFLASGTLPVTAICSTVCKSRSRPSRSRRARSFPSALITGLNSDLPGEIIGQVTEHVYDSATGRHLLIPQGSRIFGRYNADIDYGQDRAQIVWDRLIMPNGSSIALDAMIGADKAGYAGLADQVDHHGGRLFGAVLLSSLITAGANLVSNSDDNGFTEISAMPPRSRRSPSAAKSSAGSSTSSPPSPSVRASG